MDGRVPDAASLGEAVGLLESLAHRDPGARGLSSRAPYGVLGPAAFDLLSARRVAVLTGFCVRSAMAGETDGPPGALALASALRVLGKKVALVSDLHSLPLLRAGSRALKTSFQTLELPEDPGESEPALKAFGAAFKPTHVVALERPGSAQDGHRYSMRGEILDDIAPAADSLFTADRGRGYSTIALGDGGNELGMGALREDCADFVPLGRRIFCANPADFTLAAGISNWGGYALAAALSLLSGVLLVKPAEKEGEVLSAILEAGAVDGCTGDRTLSVDGLPWGEYSRTLREMYDLTAGTLRERRARAEAGGIHDR